MATKQSHAAQDVLLVVSTGQALVQKPDFVEVRKFIWRALQQFGCMSSRHPAWGMFFLDRDWALPGDKLGKRHRLQKVLYNLSSNPQSVQLNSLCLWAFGLIHAPTCSAYCFHETNEICPAALFQQSACILQQVQGFFLQSVDFYFDFGSLERKICTSLQ